MQPAAADARPARGHSSVSLREETFRFEVSHFSGISRSPLRELSATA